MATDQFDLKSAYSSKQLITRHPQRVSINDGFKEIRKMCLLVPGWWKLKKDSGLHVCYIISGQL